MSPKKKIAGIEREVPQDTRSTVVRLFSQLHGQRVRLTVVALSIVIYVALSIWNPMYSAIVIDHLWQSVQAAWNAGTPFSVTAAMGRELTSRQRQCVELCVLRGTTQQQAGRLLGVNKATVCRHLQKSQRRPAQAALYAPLGKGR